MVVPAYNEQGRIGESLCKIRDYMLGRGLEFEIIVADDGSVDSTPEIVRGVGAADQRVVLSRSERNQGKGAAVRRGVRASRGDVVLFSDADLSTPIEEIDNLLPWLDQYQLVIASRSLPDSDVVVRQPFYREMMGRAFNALVRLLVVRGLIDTQCGFKMMTRRAADEIFRRQRLNSFSFDVEVILIAKRQGLAVKEVPVRWINSRASKVHPVLDSLEMLLDLLRVKFYDISGCYKKSG